MLKSRLMAHKSLIHSRILNLQYKKVRLDKETCTELDYKGLGNVRRSSSDKCDDFSTPHPAKDPPEPYCPEKFNHKAFNPPKCIPLTAFRKFESSDEVLGPDAGKTKNYKNPEYFSYHRFSFVTIQNATIRIIKEKATVKENVEECEDESKNEDECISEAEKKKQDQCKLEAERIKKEAERYEKEKCAKKDESKECKNEAEKKMQDQCKLEAERIKKEAERYEKENCAKKDESKECKNEAEGKMQDQCKKESERIKQEAERYEKEKCKKEVECAVKEVGECQNEEEKKKDNQCNNEAERLQREAERFRKEEMKVECVKRMPEQKQKEDGKMIVGSKETEQVEKNPAIITIKTRKIKTCEPQDQNIKKDEEDSNKKNKK